MGAHDRRARWSGCAWGRGCESDPRAGLWPPPSPRNHSPNPGHRLDGFRQVVKEIRAVVHVVRRYLVAPLGPVHHHAVGHGIVLVYRPCARRVRPWSWIVQVVTRAAGSGTAVGIHDVHFHAAISGRIHRLFQQGASLGQLVLGRWRWLNAEALVNGRVWIIGRRDRPFRRQRLGVLRQLGLTKHERSKHHAVHAAQPAKRRECVRDRA